MWVFMRIFALTSSFLQIFTQHHWVFIGFAFEYLPFRKFFKNNALCAMSLLLGFWRDSWRGNSYFTWCWLEWLCLCLKFYSQDNKKNAICWIRKFDKWTTLFLDNWFMKKCHRCSLFLQLHVDFGLICYLQ